MATPSQPNLEEWVATLGIQTPSGYARCESDEERFAVVENLLKYKRKDKMSPEDETFILAGLELLRNRVREAREASNEEPVENASTSNR